MASVARSLRPAARLLKHSAAPALVLRQGTRRAYSSAPPAAKSGGNSGLIALLGLAGAGGGAYYLYTQDQLAQFGFPAPKTGPFVPTKEDYQKVYTAIADILEDNDYDDGSYGPVLVRLAWHASGTYDKDTKTGGSNGATMRFSPESDHGANAGLKAARDRLEPIKAQFPWITYSDLWILAGVCAIQEMGGPTIPFRAGRQDRDVSACTPDGRLPDASKVQDHLRAIFGRMGFSDQEIVALTGAHALGRCHTDRSGYDGPWTFSPTMLTNDFFQLLLKEKWQWKKWNGPAQYEVCVFYLFSLIPPDLASPSSSSDSTSVVGYKSWEDNLAAWYMLLQTHNSTDDANTANTPSSSPPTQDAGSKKLMMLPADMSLVKDKNFRKHVELYAKDQDKFFEDFSKAVTKLFELGVPFKEGTETWTFKPSTEE
ncbi:cytochrome c peroxidase [Ascodesmis nigricans]|uniref:Peroxidase n=1 Tax=Ascodesmis nigricans TaxID=341454 RepID=A0A4S2MP66_9PEZI|nr:cytochrome c peroxidase [Ascodesmis nigricans]